MEATLYKASVLLLLLLLFVTVLETQGEWDKMLVQTELREHVLRAVFLQAHHVTMTSL